MRVMDDEKYMKRCYELAIRAGKKGYDTFGARLVHNGEILEEAENTADLTVCCLIATLYLENLR